MQPDKRIGVVALEDARDLHRLQEVCELFLYETRWAGELGDPTPPNWRGSKKNAAVLREIRHERRVCAAIIGGNDEF